MDNQDDAWVRLARLSLEAHYPSLEEVWYEGVIMAKNNGEALENPYPKDTLEYRSFEDGWWAYTLDESPLYVLEEGKVAIERTEDGCSSWQRFYHHVTIAMQCLLGLMFSGAFAMVCYDLSLL